MKNETAYQIGKSARKAGIRDFRHACNSLFWNEIDRMSEDELVFFEAGLVGAEMPYKVTGWRYGNIPASGKSYNSRDGEFEAGVSLMAVDGGKETEDKLSALFISAGRPVVRVEGYLHTFRRGGDGEPLVICAKQIK